MIDAKLAAIMSGLSPIISGARPPKGSVSTPKAPSTTPGLGDKMRTETSSALEKALTKGKTDALAHFGKAAKAGIPTVPMRAAPAAHPAIAGLHADLASHAAAPAPTPAAPARQGASWADMHKGVAQQQAANISAQPAQLPAARAFEGMGSAAAGGGTGGGGGGGIRGALSGAGKFMRPMGKALGYGALAGGAALAYGMHRQNEEDRNSRNLVYAPMQGSYQ
jgi:hypothetical protein